MICETIVTPRADGQPADRDDITCNIQYAANGMSACNSGVWCSSCAPVLILLVHDYSSFLTSF